MSRSSSVEALIESTLTELEYELESQTVAAIPTYRWRVYTDDKDNTKAPWRLHRQISARSMDPGKLRSFESDCLHRLAPTAGPLATQIAIQRCKWNGQRYAVDDALACRVLNLATGNVSTCTHPRPPADC